MLVPAGSAAASHPPGAALGGGSRSTHTHISCRLVLRLTINIVRLRGNFSLSMISVLRLVVSPTPKHETK